MDHSYDYHVRRFKPHRSSNWIRWMWRAHFWPKFRLKRMLGSKGSPHSSAYIWNFKAKISRSFIFLNVGYDYCVRRIKPNMSSNWIRAVWRAHFWLKFCVKRMLGSKASPYSSAYIWKFKAKIIRSFIFLNVGYDFFLRRFNPNRSSN
jgi:hypothetical protein